MALRGKVLLLFVACGCAAVRMSHQSMFQRGIVSNQSSNQVLGQVDFFLIFFFKETNYRLDLTQKFGKMSE